MGRTKFNFALVVVNSDDCDSGMKMRENNQYL